MNNDVFDPAFVPVDGSEKNYDRSETDYFFVVLDDQTMAIAVPDYQIDIKVLEIIELFRIIHQFMNKLHKLSAVFFLEAADFWHKIS